MNNSWPTVAKINLTGWGVCPVTTTTGMLKIILEANAYTDATGYNPAGFREMHLVPSDILNGNRMQVPHEFGHALGYEHEFNRPDFPDGPVGAHVCSGPDLVGDTVDTAPDPESILVSTNYCNLNTELSLWDAIGAQATYGARVDLVSPLRTGLHGTDYATVATAAGVSSLKTVGYEWKFAEGWVFNQQVPGTVALQLFWNSGAQDNFLTATADGAQSARNAGYTFIRNEGYVFTSQQTGTVPLETYYSDAGHDNIAVTPGPSEDRVKAAGYRFVRIEGYIPKKTPYDIIWTFWSGSREDNLATKQYTQLAVDAETASYAFFGFDGAVFRYPFVGTTPLMNYYSSARGDHFALATLGSQNDAVAAGYVLSTDENLSQGDGSQYVGYLYTSAANGTSPMKSFYNDARGDHFTTISRESTATAAGYRSIRTEGWGLPINP